MSAMPTFLGNYEAGTSEWEQQRTHAMTGSRIAAVLGLSPWESRFSLWLRMQGMAPPQQVNTSMEWGTRLENAVLTKWTENHPTMTALAGGTFCHPERTWQRANPDRVFINGTTHGILEVKTADKMDDGWGPNGTDEIPVYYRCQGLWYADIFGIDTAHFAVLIGGNDYREYVITAQDGEREYLRNEGKAFLDSLTSGERPDIDAHSSTYQVLRELHPDIDPVDVEIEPALALAYRTSLTNLKAAKTEQDLRSAQVLDAIGRGKRAVCCGDKIALRMAKAGGTPYLKSSIRDEPVTTIRKAA